jgi:hypothetical protein
MLDPRIVAARIHGCLALEHGEALPDDSTRPSSQGVFIKIRMPQLAGPVQRALFSISEIVGQGSDRANEKS